MGIVAASVVAAMAGAVVTGVKNKKPSDLFLTNLEALAESESGNLVDKCYLRCHDANGKKCIISVGGLDITCCNMEKDS